MLGGAVMAGRASQRATYREEEQEQRLDSLEDRPAAPPVQAAPAVPAIASQLQQLSELKTSGALSAEEFEAAKRKLLAS
jgi:hypothetical protein